MEWTLTALELARRHQFGFLDEPTYRYYETTPEFIVEECRAQSSPRRRCGADCRRDTRVLATTPPCGAVTEPMCHNVSWECARQGRTARRVATSRRVIEVSGRYGIRAVLGETDIRLVAPSVRLRFESSVDLSATRSRHCSFAPWLTHRYRDHSFQLRAQELRKDSGRVPACSLPWRCCSLSSACIGFRRSSVPSWPH